MILNNVNSDDYIYLKLLEDMKLDGRNFPKGTIRRFSIAKLRDMIWKREVRDILYIHEPDDLEKRITDKCFGLKLIPKSDISKQSFLPQDLYGRVVVAEDTELYLRISPEDLIVIDEWLTKKLNSPKFSWEAHARDDARSIAEYNKTFFDNGILTASNNSMEGLAPVCNQGIFQYLGKSKGRNQNDIHDGGNVISTSKSDNICLPLEEGEILDLSNPVVLLLFMNQEVMRFLLKTEVVPEEEKAELFIRDFAGLVPEAKRRYFKLHDYIKIKSLLMGEINRIWPIIEEHAPNFYNYFYDNYWRYSTVDDFDFDSEGYLRYVHTGDEPLIEVELAKIADRVSAEKGRLHYEHEILAQEKKEREERLEKEALKYFKEHKKRFFKLQRINPDLTKLEFMLNSEEQDKTMKRVLIKRLNSALKKRIDNLSN